MEGRSRVLATQTVAAYAVEAVEGGLRLRNRWTSATVNARGELVEFLDLRWPDGCVSPRDRPQFPSGAFVLT